MVVVSGVGWQVALVRQVLEGEANCAHVLHRRHRQCGAAGGGRQGIWPWLAGALRAPPRPH